MSRVNWKRENVIPFKYWGAICVPFCIMWHAYNLWVCTKRLIIKDAVFSRKTLTKYPLRRMVHQDCPRTVPSDIVFYLRSYLQESMHSLILENQFTIKEWTEKKYWSIRNVLLVFVTNNCKSIALDWNIGWFKKSNNTSLTCVSSILFSCRVDRQKYIGFVRDVISWHFMLDIRDQNRTILS